MFHCIYNIRNAVRYHLSIFILSKFKKLGNTRLGQDWRTETLRHSRWEWILHYGTTMNSNLMPIKITNAHNNYPEIARITLLGMYTTVASTYIWNDFCTSLLIAATFVMAHWKYSKWSTKGGWLNDCDG